jgi:hypothetical protein
MIQRFLTGKLLIEVTSLLDFGQAPQVIKGVPAMTDDFT